MVAAPQEPLSDAARLAHREQSERGMESFITEQLHTILQPVLARLEEIDERMDKLDAGVHAAHTDIARNRMKVDTNYGGIDSLVERMRKVEEKSKQLEESIAETDEKTDNVLLEVTKTKTDVQLTTTRLEDKETGALPMLEVAVQRLEEKQNQARRHLEAVASIVDDHPLKKDIADLRAQFQASTGDNSNQAQENARLQKDIDGIIQTIQDVHQTAENNRMHGTALQKSVQDVAAREGQLHQLLNGWKDQWSKLHPEIQACAKGINEVKTRSDHHDSAIHSIQHGCIHNAKGVEALHHNLDLTRSEMLSLKQELDAAQGDATTNREGLDEARKAALALRGELDGVARGLQKTAVGVERLDSRSAAVLEHVQKNTSAVASVQSEHRQAVAMVQTVQRDLERTKDNLTATKTDLASASSNMEVLKTDLRGANATLHRLDHGVEFCHAGFSGLQKGFMATGTHIQQRDVRKAVALPSVTTPRPASSGRPMSGE